MILVVALCVRTCEGSHGRVQQNRRNQSAAGQRGAVPKVRVSPAEAAVKASTRVAKLEAILVVLEDLDATDDEEVVQLKESLKTQISNRGGHIPTDHDVVRNNSLLGSSTGWFGDLHVPAALRGIRVLGTPLGTSEFVQAQLQATMKSHEVLESCPCGPGSPICLFCCSFSAHRREQLTICGFALPHFQ